MSLLGATYADPPKGPDGKPQGPPPISGRIWLGLAATILGSFISNLDTRLSSFSLADLRGGVGYGQDEASWIAVAYNVAEIAVVPVTAWLSGVISPRRALALAATLLTVAGALCPLAADQGFTWLIAARFVQGLGGGALIPLLLTILLRFLPLHQRIYGFAAYALLTASTPLITESLAGFLTDVYGWRSVFYAGAALGPVVIVLALAGLPVEPAKPDMFRDTDYLGMFLLAVSTSLLTAALVVGQRLNWFTNGLIDSLFLAFALLFVAFLVAETTSRKPLIDLSLVGRMNFGGGLLAVFAFAFSTLATSTILPQFGTAVHGFRETQIGQILVLAALAQVVACAAGVFLIRVMDTRLLLVLGLFIATIGERLATFIDSDWVLADIVLSHLIQAFGQPLIMFALLVIATSSLRPQDAVSGATIFNVVRTLAGSIGSAVIGGILTVRERVHSAFIVDHLTAGAPAIVQAQAAGGLVGRASIQATTMAVADGYGWIGMVTLASMLLGLILHKTALMRPPAGS